MTNALPLRTPLSRWLIAALVVASRAALGLTLCAGLSLALACKKDEEPVASDAIYTCAMHPEVRQPEPGDCPICGMTLVLAGGDERATDTVTLSPASEQLAHVRTTRVSAGTSAGPSQEFTGRIAINEGNEHVLTSWVGGRIERLLVRTVGEQVRRGQTLARIYSPEVYAAAGDLRAALRQLERLSGQNAAFRSAAEQTVESARQRLRLLGFSGAALTQLESTPSRTVSIRAPYSGTVVEKLVRDGAQVGAGEPLLRIADLSSVWAQLEVPEAAAASIRVGQPVRLFVQGVDSVIEAPVDFVQRTLSARGRVDVRVVVPNDDGALRPGMVVRGEIGGGTSDPAVMIPASAPLITGDTSVVYVLDEGANEAGGPGTERRFRLREVALGPRVGGPLDGRYPVLDGLEDGEIIVIEGAFMIDAELTLQGGAGMMAPREPTATTITDERLSEAMVPALNALLDLNAALGNDDAAAATSAGQRLREATVRVHASTTRGEQLWRGASVRLARALQGDPSDLDAWRSRLPALDAVFTDLLRALPNPTGAPVHRAFCPMAGSEGAHWLQREDEVRNAYYGASMLTCGTIEDTIAPEARLE